MRAEDAPITSGPPGLPHEGALAAAVDSLRAAMESEEARFNNLTNRALNLLFATSIVTTLAGSLGIPLLDDVAEKPIRLLIGTCLVAAVASLWIVAYILVWRVISPKKRVVFGDNTITEEPGSLATESDVLRVLYTEYWKILNNLDTRNDDKGKGLHTASTVFVISVGIIALGILIGVLYSISL